ncbi:MAG: hypothetical protein ACLFUT_13285 [Desulfobacteraceae bacterium]
MSRYMQIDIRVVPFFEKPFEKSFPNLVNCLRQLSYNDLVEKDPCLYHLTDHLVMIAESPNTPADIKERLRPYVVKLEPLKEQAREFLLSRHLNELDRLLYRMEDVFEDLEGAL